jgi:hypothetical protein
MGQPDAHLVRQVVLTEELAELMCEPVGIDDLAIDHEADREWVDDCLAHTTAISAAGWQRDDSVGADVESDGRD